MGTGLKHETFGDAFKRNKANGEKEFEYKGKKYTTKTKEDGDKDIQAAGSKFAKMSNAMTNAPKGTSDTAKSALMRATQDASKDYEKKARSSGYMKEADAKTKANLKSMAAKAEEDDVQAAIAENVAFDRKSRAAEDNDLGQTYGMKKGGKVSSASSRGDGIAQRGKTRGKVC